MELFSIRIQRTFQLVSTLNKYGVKLDRGQTSGPRVKQNPKEDGTNEGGS